MSDREIEQFRKDNEIPVSVFSGIYTGCSRTTGPGMNGRVEMTWVYEVKQKPQGKCYVVRGRAMSHTCNKGGGSYRRGSWRRMN